MMIIITNDLIYKVDKHSKCLPASQIQCHECSHYEEAQRCPFHVSHFGAMHHGCDP